MNFKLKKRDQFKGRKGKILRKQLYGSKKSNHEVIDEEIKKLDQAKSEFDSSKANLFTDFPLSQKTLKGLASGKFEKPTDIQREAIHLALNGNDILGAAKTGSGKTLAFLVPVLECLFREKWSQNDGLGALIISPTRELAFQTFEVLKKIGKFHDFSAGLVIGGKPLKEEAGRINRTNIVVCTPGRLLQHMDETSYFTADSLKLLVLDEADRILDLGFAQTMNAIIENLPSERQTLLFSATQTRSVKDLARLSLHDPVFVSVHENASQSTPVQLEQEQEQEQARFVECEEQKQELVRFVECGEHKQEQEHEQEQEHCEEWVRCVECEEQVRWVECEEQVKYVKCEEQVRCVEWEEQMRCVECEKQVRCVECEEQVRCVECEEQVRWVECEDQVRCVECEEQVRCVECEEQVRCVGCEEQVRCVECVEQ
ncbi:hypothetical protein DPMN_052981, partial [Dreissena polymorpha]